MKVLWGESTIRMHKFYYFDPLWIRKKMDCTMLNVQIQYNNMEHTLIFQIA